MENLSTDVGCVVIGRNEGERLKQCITSILDSIENIVYVDSGSSDGSVEFAESVGVDVVRLDMTVPFSAARARNEGFRFLSGKSNRQLKYIQFVDGDCQCCDGWLLHAYSYLQIHESVAIVAGRRKEKHPEQSIYNKLCDIEWDTPTGKAKACGGDFMVRAAAFIQVGGFNPHVVSGEEPELCYRLSGKDWIIYRLDHPMTVHDAQIESFSQWCKRSIRTGHGYAQGFLLHFRDRKGYCSRESARIWFWAFVLPICILIPSILFHASFLLLGLVYPVQFVRIFFKHYKHHGDLELSIIYSFSVIIGKWPEFIGQLLYLARKLLRKKHTIIEYN
jgi:glycosyltransferase involved in cell wall biosynthesis